MKNRILNFIISNHFMLRKWERSIDLPLLYKVLPFVKCTQCNKDVVFVLPSFLKEKGIAKDDKKCLVLVLSRNIIVTAYWCDNPNYIFDKKDTPHYQILY
jgi:hypothetical protein